MLLRAIVGHDRTSSTRATATTRCSKPCSVAIGRRGSSRDKLATRTIQTHRPRFEESFQSQKWPLEEIPGQGRRNVACDEHNRRIQEGMPIQVERLCYVEHDLVKQVQPIADRTRVHHEPVL